MIIIHADVPILLDTWRVMRTSATLNTDGRVPSWLSLTQLTLHVHVVAWLLWSTMTLSCIRTTPPVLTCFTPQFLLPPRVRSEAGRCCGLLLASHRRPLPQQPSNQSCLYRLWISWSCSYGKMMILPYSNADASDLWLIDQLREIGQLVRIQRDHACYKSYTDSW
jgi:hypothetical protein